MQMDSDTLVRVDAQEYEERKLMPLEAFRKRLRAALLEEGYASREEIVALVNEIKHEQVNSTPWAEKISGRKVDDDAIGRGVCEGRGVA